MIIVKGKLNGNDAVVISIEGKFQGGGIGEVSGAKFAGTLEKILKECKKGNRIYPIIIYDTGGVRLQEANYGLLSIAEISCGHRGIARVCACCWHHSRKNGIFWWHVLNSRIMQCIDYDAGRPFRNEWTGSHPARSGNSRTGFQKQ